MVMFHDFPAILSALESENLLQVLRNEGEFTLPVDVVGCVALVAPGIRKWRRHQSTIWTFLKLPNLLTSPPPTKTKLQHIHPTPTPNNKKTI